LPINIPPELWGIAFSLNSLNKTALLVGGAVRDHVMGLPSKDMDVEVFNCSYDWLQDFLAPLGKVDAVGQSFGVIKLTTPIGTYDFSIPRIDNRVGVKHTDFSCEFDPKITPKVAASRRDFTMNSLMWNPVTGEMLDFYGGVHDIERKKLVATSPAFTEDNLRLWRAVQFACRFDMEIEGPTSYMCSAMVCNHANEPCLGVSKERIWEEWHKLLMKGTNYLQLWPALKDTGLINALYKPLRDLVGIEQDTTYHPEGDASVHSMYVMNAMRDLCGNDPGMDRTVMMAAALCHDLGKANTTKLREVRGQMRWTSYDHQITGVPLAESFLCSIGAPRHVIAKVNPLVRWHMAHMDYHSKPKFVRQLAQNMSPSNITELTMLINADHSGRPPLPKGLPDKARAMWIDASEELCADHPQRKFVRGVDVLRYYPEGPKIGEIVKEAYALQLDGKINSFDGGSEWLANRARKDCAIVKGADLVARGIQGPDIKRTLDAAWALQQTNMKAYTTVDGILNDLI